MGFSRKKGESAADDAAATAAPGCCGACCASIPWFKTACTLVILAATIIFSVKSSSAFAAVRALLADLKVSAGAQATVASATSGMLGCGLAVLVVVLVLAAIATLAAMSGKARRYRLAHGGKLGGSTAGACCEAASSGLVIALLWIFLALVVAMIALWTAFFLGTFSGDHGASYAMGTTDKVQERLAGALKKADALFQKMKSAWDGLMKSVPSFMKSSSWFQDLTRDIGGPIQAGSKDTAEATCPPTCLDLGVFATMMAFEPRCVCSAEMLTSVKTRMRGAWRDTAWSLAALVAAAVAGSFVLMATIGSFVGARRDLRDIKRANREAAGAGAGAAVGAGGGGKKAGDALASAGGNDVEAAGAADQLMSRA